MLAENVNYLKSHGLIDENIVVDNYADRFWSLFKWNTWYYRSRIFGFFWGFYDCAEEEEEKDKESKANSVPLKSQNY